VLDADISTAHARRLLSVPDTVPDTVPSPRVDGWTRRDFLRAIGLGVVGGAALGTVGDGLIGGLFGSEVREAFAAPPLGPGEHVVITIVLYGGNDGLNTVVPFTDPHYYRQRPAISIRASACTRRSPISSSATTPARWPSCRGSATPTRTCRTSRRWPSG
jgi:hypothetical protein